MQPQVEQMVEKLEHLSPNRLAEVADFLQQRDQGKQLKRVYSQASETSFNKVWDNEEDAIYDSF